MTDTLLSVSSALLLALLLPKPVIRTVLLIEKPTVCTRHVSALLLRPLLTAHAYPRRLDITILSTSAINILEPAVETYTSEPFSVVWKVMVVRTAILETMSFLHVVELLIHIQTTKSLRT